MTEYLMIAALIVVIFILYAIFCGIIGIALEDKAMPIFNNLFRPTRYYHVPPNSRLELVKIPNKLAWTLPYSIVQYIPKSK